MSPWIPLAQGHMGCWTLLAVSPSSPTPSRNNRKLEPGHWRLPLHPGGVPALVQFLRPAPGVHILEGPPAPPFPPERAAGPQPFPAKWSAHLRRLIGPAPGVPGWLRLPGAVGLLRQNGRRVFPSSLCFPPTKGRVRVAARLCSAAWQPGRNLCQKDGGRLARGYKGADLPLLPGFLPGPSFPFLPFLSPSSCTHSGSVSARLPRRAASLPRAGQGWRWEARLLAPEKKEKKKAFQPLLLVRKPEGMRNDPFWRPNDKTPSEGRILQTNDIYLP